LYQALPALRASIQSRPDVPTLESGPRVKKRLLFLLAGFNSQLDELDQNAVVAQPPAIPNPFNLFSHRRGKGHAAPELPCGCHATGIHHCGAHSDSAVWEVPKASGNRGDRSARSPV